MKNHILGFVLGLQILSFTSHSLAQESYDSLAAPRTPLLWEKSRPESKAWSEFVLTLIGEDLAPDFMRGTEDITEFCPRYYGLSDEQRTLAWGMLISAITKYESAYNPLSRMRETTMGTDPVTKLPVYSEGLLQLSYQDVQWARYCKFDWQADRNLPVASPKKTILDPYTNLDCGIRILASQIRRKNRIGIKSGAYWAVIIPGGKYSKLSAIQELVKKTPGCM